MLLLFLTLWKEASLSHLSSKIPKVMHDLTGCKFVKWDESRAFVWIRRRKMRWCSCRWSAAAPPSLLNPQVNADAIHQQFAPLGIVIWERISAMIKIINANKFQYSTQKQSEISVFSQLPIYFLWDWLPGSAKNDCSITQLCPFPLPYFFRKKATVFSWFLPWALQRRKMVDPARASLLHKVKARGALCFFCLFDICYFWRIL